MRRKANTLPDATSPAPGAVLAVHRSQRNVNPVFDPVSAVSLQVLWLRLLLPYPCATTVKKCSPFKNSTTQKTAQEHRGQTLIWGSNSTDNRNIVGCAVRRARPHLLDASPLLSSMFSPRRSRLFPDPELGNATRSRRNIISMR